MGKVEPIRSKKNIGILEKYLEKQNYRNYLLFCFGINSGLRISDILNLNINDVKNKNFVEIKEQKTGKLKKFPLNEKLKKILKIYLKNKKNDKSALFKTKYNNRMDRFTAYRILNDACKRNGIPEKIGTHTLRKTFGYHFYKKYKDVAMLQKIFNHSSQSITLRYIGIEDEEIYKSYITFCL